MEVNLTQRDWFSSDKRNKSLKSLKTSPARTYGNPHHFMPLATPTSPVFIRAIAGNTVFSNQNINDQSVNCRIARW